MRKHCLGTLCLFGSFSISVCAEPSIPSPCAVVGEIAAAVELYSTGDTGSIATSLVSDLMLKFGAQCSSPSKYGMTTCKTAEGPENFEFRVYDQLKRDSNGIALAGVIVKPVSKSFDLNACFASERFNTWKVDEFNKTPCVPSIWKLGPAKGTYLHIELMPLPTCDGESKPVFIALAKGVRPAIKVN